VADVFQGGRFAVKPRLLDLFCGAGGAARGYMDAGFYVVGVDINAQPNYCGDEFVQADALDLLRQWRDDFDPDEGASMGERGHDVVGELVGGAAVAVGRFDVQVDEDLTRHGTPFVGVPADYPKPASEVKSFGFDAIHASPPCQAFTALRVMHNARQHEDLLTPTRDLLIAIGLPYVIENVPGAPMATLTRLCGTSFGLGAEAYDEWRELRRHRYFETSFSLLSPPCQHAGPTIGIYGDHARDRRRNSNTGEKGVDFPDRDKLALGKAAMGMPWAQRWKEVSEAIPPAYTRFIGEQLMAHLQRQAA
jgi:DNA (cytosine-5)-methyltransferase 1